MIKRSNFVFIAAALFAVACTDTSNIPPPVELPPNPPGPTPPPPTSALQVVHASSNAPTVNVSVGETAAQQNLDFKEARTPRQFAPGTYTITVDANLPDDGDDDTDDTTEVISVPDVALNADELTTVVAYGLVGGTGPQALTAWSKVRTGDVPASTVEATILHAAAGIGTPSDIVDIYITVPGGDVTVPGDVVEFLDNVELGQSADVTLAEGSYEVQITAGTATLVLFGSGTFAVEGGTSFSDPIVAAVPNTNAGSAALVSLLVIGRIGVEEIQDEETQAEVRAIHTISDLSGAVDIVVSVDNSAAGEDPMWEEDGRIEDLVFTDVEPDPQLPGGNGFDDVEPGTYRIQVYEANTDNCLINCGTPAEGEDPAVDPETTTLAQGVFYDAIAQGLTVPAEGETEADPPAALAYEADDRRSLATAAKLRIIHSSGSTGAVDVYIVAGDVTDISSVDPTLEGVPFGANTGYLSLVPGATKVIITATESKEAVIDTGSITLDAAGVYTAIARDAGTGEMGPGLILLDDFTTGGT